MPFFAEKMYQGLKLDNMAESVHLTDWPKSGGQTDLGLEQSMNEARDIVNLSLAKRAEVGVKVRQPLAKLKVKSQKFKVLEEELLNLIKDEVNVKEVAFDNKIKEDVELDTNITQELKEEGIVRDIVRYVQDMRKISGLKPSDEILVSFVSPAKINKIIEKNKEWLLKEIRARIYSTNTDDKKWLSEKEVLVDHQKLLIKMKRVI